MNPVALSITHASLFPQKLLGTKIVNPASWNKVQHWATFFPEIILKTKISFPREVVLFDALAGENACHTRAVKLTDLACDYRSDPHIKKEFEDTQKQLSEIIERAKKMNFESLPKGITFREFLEKNGMDFPLTERMHYLTQCFFLNLVKQQDLKNGRIMQRTNPKSLAQDQFSNAESTALIEMHQKELAKDSCDYFYREAKQLSQPTLASLIRKPLHKEDKSGRSAIPAYIAMDVFMHRMIEKKQSILLKIIRCEGDEVRDQLAIPFHSSKERGGFYASDPLIEQTPHVVVQGFVKYPVGAFEEKACYQDRLLGTPLMDILMANAAALPQYAGHPPETPLPFEEWHQEAAGTDLSAELKNQENRYIHYKELSSKGFAYSNPSLFCIDHIYCDMS